MVAPMSVVPQRIEVIDGELVELTWEDGVVSQLDAATLRGACMCAGCREPAGESVTQAVLAGPIPIKIAGAELVGGYALQFVFEPDGHGTGIYPFAALRELSGM
jgi:DUF971 family protein